MKLTNQSGNIASLTESCIMNKCCRKNKIISRWRDTVCHVNYENLLTLTVGSEYCFSEFEDIYQKTLLPKFH